MANSSSRGHTRVIWVVVHTAEGIRKASDLKAFFDRSTSSSAHAVADDHTLLDALVPYDRASWTLRNGNSRSDNLELCGFASWSREEWLNHHRGMLFNAALWIRRRCLARGVPIVKLSPADVRAGKAGVIGHHDYTVGTGDGTHWDPGPGFPWDIVIKAARGATTKENDVELTDAWDEDKLNALGPSKLGWALLNIKQNVAATRKLVTTQGATINALIKLVASSDANDLTEAQVREAVRSEIANAVIDVDVTVGGQAIESGEGQ